MNVLNFITSSQVNGLSKYPHTTWTYIPSWKKKENAYTLPNKAYTVVRIGGSFEGCISF
jgi:hypothetical protein